ncbi:hypothetical protein Clacol_003726 [Clathrus columnatus]|uniref:CN hydrolase domain-containing protein n=1 Tax=Clathrus columnatus TaxID=1419009 RepID=A0AAV5A8I3_9AGAM|nr:hypothetical protein Clacol_003726 [Clathrus columnatus]
MAHIAIEGRCFVLSACQYAQQKDFPADHAIASDAKRDPEGVMIGGGSVIYNPLGEPVIGPLVEGEGVLTASLDLDDIVRGKFDLDVVGHYARPDKRKQTEIMQPYFEKRRDVLKTIPYFWSRALRNMPGIAMQLQHEMDQDAMRYLEDIWIHFKPNPYFTDSVLKKEFKYLPPSVPDNTPDENGITSAMMEFDWEQHVAPQAIKINWKDDAKNLTKLYSRVPADEEDDETLPAEAGSFFNFFEYADDVMETGTNIINDLFPEALEWFRGVYGLDEDESSEEDEDDEDEDEIDLEKPRKKKQKTA